MSPGNDAWHEAGHALAAHLLGGTVRELSLESDEDGATGHARVAWGPASERAHDERLATVALAGLVAEQVFTGDDVLDDLSAVSAWRPDWEEAERRLAALHDDLAARERARRTLLHDLRDRFEEPGTYETLARIADQLDAHGTLDEALFLEALGED